MPHRVTATVLALGTLALTTACLPYSLASTAQTVPVGESKSTGTVWFMPNGMALKDTALTKPHTLIGGDMETRWGVSHESDFGLRIPSGSGIVATYKRRLAGYPDPDSAAFAWQLGGGLVNWGNHALGEFSLITSGPRRGAAVMYGGARVMHVEALSEGAVHDDPSIGLLFGARISVGSDDEIIPEIAVYHDRSALGIRKSEIIFVPSISGRGSSVLKLLGAIGRVWGLGGFGRMRDASSRSPQRR